MTPEEIVEAAKARGLSMSEVFKAAGISHSTFSRWKAGITEPTLGVYRRIVDAAHGGALVDSSSFGADIVVDRVEAA